jgi:hypothetical protein
MSIVDKIVLHYLCRIHFVFLTSNIQGVSKFANSERGREGPSGARKILRKKKFALPEEDISTLILFNT